MYTNQQVELLREALKQNSASMESTEIQYIFHNVDIAKLSPSSSFSGSSGVKWQVDI